MGFFDNIMNSMRLNQDDDYDLDDDYDFDEEEAPAPKRGGLFARRNAEDDYDYDDDDAYEAPKTGGLFGSKKVSSINSARKPAMEVTMIKPTSIEDSREICDYLLSGKAVVLNMEGLHMEVAQRIIDFTSGATYSMNGNLQKISNYIFIATPQSVELSGDFQNILASTGSLDMGGMNIRM